MNLTEFKVVAVSSNTNSFGLTQMIVINRVGKTFSMCANYLNVKKQGASLHKHPTKGFGSVELVEELTTAPREVIKEIFK